jgi:glycosyltransferase involved in cell wall biosynthesis
VHGFSFHEESDPKTLRRYAMLERIAAYACHRVITVSEYHRRWALDLKIAGANKIVAIPNGIPLDRAKIDRDSRTLRQALAVAPGTCLLLSVGRLAEQKGLEYLLQALPHVQREMKIPFKLILVGTGPLKPKLKEMIRELGLRKQVTFLGFRKDVGNLLAASDIAVLPSLHEGLSIALLEAMAAGKPIITTTIGSNLEVTRHGRGALLVPAKDSGALARAICRLANDFSLRVSTSQQAKALYNKHYTEDRMLKSYRAEYLQLLSTSPNRAAERNPSRLRAHGHAYRTEASS